MVYAHSLLVVAMITSFTIWYIVNGHPAGIIVFIFLFTFFEFYFILKSPRLVIIGMLSMVTQGKTTICTPSNKD